MTRLIIDQTLPLKSYSVEDWEAILEHGSFRGYNIQHLQRKLEKDPDSIQFDEEKVSLVYAKKNGELVELSLNKIKKCKSRWSFSRFIYWIKTALFCAENTDVHKLATVIHEKIQLIGDRDKLTEKAKWSEHKATYNFSTMAEMKEVIPNKIYDLIDQMEVTDQHKVLLGKVHQAKEFYKNTHFTFIHGQSLSYWVINQLVKELEKMANPEQDLSLYHFLRLPHKELKKTRQEHIDASQHNSQYDFYLGDELLSVDGSFFHDYTYESTNHFVKANSSFLSSNQTEVIQKILEKYSVHNPNNFQKIKNLCSQFKAVESIGHIYAISIPKEKFADYVYTSHNWGVACQCIEDNDQLRRINKLQKNIRHPHCDFFENNIPQYRILTHFLNPEETPITLHTPVSKAVKDDFKSQIRALAEELYSQGVA